MYRFLVDLLQPHTLLLLWASWSLFRLWRKRNDPKRRWWPLFVPLLGLTVLSLPVVAHVLLLTLESYAPPLEEWPTDAQAIVVFAAGVRAPEGPRLRAEMDEDSFQRCSEAARLYKQGRPSLVLVSGGKVDPDTPGPSYAAVMGELLEHVGVRPPDLVLEENSQTTYENAAACAQILADRKVHRVVLVADAVDMYRAAGCLRKQGIEVIAAPCHFRATRFQPGVLDFVPSPGGAGGVQRVWHEWVGILWYRCRGRL
jgi:uncharacterized SAM-binding protein YcdF (DUF218 family)